MKTANRSLLFLTVLLALLVISTSAVFAKELGMLTISGPGIQGEVTLNDHEAMLNLEKSGFFDTAILATMPKGLGEGYSLTAHLNLDGKLVPYIEMVYYPTKEGQAGYVHYTSRLEGQAFKTIDEWHLLNRNADTALRELLLANDIAVQSALIAAPVKEPVAVPVMAPVPPLIVPVLTPGLIFVVLVGILALAGVIVALRRRASGQPTA